MQQCYLEQKYKLMKRSVSWQLKEKKRKKIKKNWNKWNKRRRKEKKSRKANFLIRLLLLQLKKSLKQKKKEKKKDLRGPGNRGARFEAIGEIGLKPALYRTYESSHVYVLEYCVTFNVTYKF